MLPKMKARALRRWRYGAAALAMSVPLAIPATASAHTTNFPVPGTPNQTLVNRVKATAVDNGRTVFKLGFEFRQTSAKELTVVNDAQALADECNNCDAIAIAVHIVFVPVWAVSTINADNTATAVNYNCDSSCASLAEAYQLVIASTDSVYPTPAQLQAMGQAELALEHLKNSGLTNDQINSQTADIISQLVTGVENNPSQASLHPLTTFTPTVGGPAQPAQLTQISTPIVNVYRDVQSH